MNTFVLWSKSDVCQNECKLAPYTSHIWFILLHQFLRHVNFPILRCTYNAALKFCNSAKIMSFKTLWFCVSQPHFRGVDVFVTKHFNSHHSNKGCLVIVVDLTVRMETSTKNIEAIEQHNKEPVNGQFEDWNNFCVMLCLQHSLFASLFAKLTCHNNFV